MSDSSYQKILKRAYAQGVVWTHIENLATESVVFEHPDFDLDALIAVVKDLADALNVRQSWVDEVVKSFEDAAEAAKAKKGGV